MPCVHCVCVCDFTRIYWSVKLKHYAEASYHGGSEGNVVNERRGQSRDPHHQDNGYGQALVFWHRLRGEIIRASDNCFFHCHSDADATPSARHRFKSNTSITFFLWHWTSRQGAEAEGMKLFECVTRPQVVVVVSLSFISELCTHRHSGGNSPHVTSMMLFVPSW